MGVITTISTPQPEVEKDEHLGGMGNVDNSETGGEHSLVNDYSVDLNFVSLHLNTLASSGALVLIVLICLLFGRFLLKRGATRMLNSLMNLKCLLPCCCHRDREPDLGLQEPSAPAIQPLPDVALQAGEPVGGPGGSQQDQQGPQGPSIVEQQGLHSLLMQELKSLKKAAKYSRRLESVSLGVVRGLRDEVADMWALLREEVEDRQRTQVQQSETRN